MLTSRDGRFRHNYATAHADAERTMSQLGCHFPHAGATEVLLPNFANHEKPMSTGLLLQDLHILWPVPKSPGQRYHAPPRA